MRRIVAPVSKIGLTPDGADEMRHDAVDAVQSAVGHRPAPRADGSYAVGYDGPGYDYPVASAPADDADDGVPDD